MKEEETDGRKGRGERGHRAAGGVHWPESCEKRDRLKGPGVDSL